VATLDAADLADLLRSAHARHRGQLPAGWPVATSEQALEALLAHGLPDTRAEEWRYTSLAGFAERLGAALVSSAAPAAPTAATAPPLAAAIIGALPGTVLELTDGHVAATPALPTGLYLRPAALAVPGFAAIGSTPLGDLNTAFASDGLHLGLAAGTALQAPVLVHERASDPAVVSQPRLRVALGQDSALTLVLLATGAAGTSTNSSAEIEVGDGATLRLVTLYEGAADAQRIARCELRLGRGATILVTAVDLGASLARQDLVVQLAGDDASVDIAGLCLGPAGTHVDHHLDLQHSARRATSRTLYRSVVDAGGRVVFNGRIVVAAGAAGTNAALTNRNLLLAPNAEVDTKPELEIHTDDVRCSHGATTGQLDPAALFYLRSRGIAVAEARRLLVGAFTDELVGRIAMPAVETVVRDRIRALIDHEAKGT
jgi:Fe-S cluster assembly protein SufD